MISEAVFYGVSQCKKHTILGRALEARFLLTSYFNGSTALFRFLKRGYIVIVPKMGFLTQGVGRHKDKLASFEMALRNAGIAPYNLVKVSSIFPPHCKLLSKKDGAKHLRYGQVLFVVMSENYTNEPNRVVSASIGLALPKDRSKYGYISEYHTFGETKEKVGRYAEYLAETMMSTIIDPEGATEPIGPRRGGGSVSVPQDEIKIAGKVFKTSHVTQTARGDKDGLWTAVVAAMVMIT